MPKNKMNHDECRKAICIVCGGKSDRGEGISSSLSEMIREYILEDFTFDDDRLPVGLCKSHVNLLHEYKNQNFSRKLVIQSFEKYAGYTTRQSCEEGNCHICNVARSTPFNGPLPKKPNRGRPSLISSDESASLPTSIKICMKCFAKIGRGLPHSCSRSEKSNNTLVRLSPKSKEIVCSTVLKEKCKVSPQVTLATKGRPISINFDSPDQRQLTSQNFSDLQCSINLSANHANAVACMIRSNLGTNFVESNLRENLSKLGSRLSDYFESCNMGFFEKQPGKGFASISRPLVIAKDLNGLLNEIRTIRNFRDSDDLMYKLGIDGGQGFFKVCLNIVHIPNEVDPVAKTFSSASKEGSVKGLFILAIVPEIEENYVNVQICLESIPGLHDLPYVVSTDLKLANLLSGLQSHGAQHPCCYCEGTAGMWESDAKMRTIGSIKQNNEAWIQKGSKSADSKVFKNCVHQPLIRENDDLILFIIPPPELHLLMGAFNTMYKGIKAIFPSAVEKWSNDLYVKPAGYHGGDNFIGGDCYKLLKNVDKLAAMDDIRLPPYVDAFRKLLKVVESCFGQKLLPAFQDDICAFEISYKALEISCTPKIHILTRHVPQFCNQLKQPLGFYSEQASESVHATLKAFWQRRKINNIEHINYQFALKDTIVEFNSRHL